MKVNHKGDYEERRRQEYPPIEEQLDAIFKGGQEFADMKRRIDEVKTKYPKPIDRP